MITVSDNGIGMPSGVTFGRGLTGMQERLRALGGRLKIKSGNGQTSIEGIVPLARAS